MSDYEQTLAWLYSLEAARGMDFKLERVALALESLGNPHRSFPSLHVGGTNGKGSVAAMLHSVLGAAGYRVGLYTSPHLVRFTERFRVGDREIEPADVVALAADVRRSATSRGIDLTFFEIVTVMAFLHFARQRVDVAVVEVGLGGRLDATNVIDPLVSVITTIGRDHTQYLGTTIASIAAEKGGIVKPGRLLVLGRVGPQAKSVLCRIARERGSRVLAAGRDYRIDRAPRPTFVGPGGELRDLDLGLRGEHQCENAATALAALAVVRDRFPVSEAAVRAGLAAVRWPGRLEIAATEPLTILDGAHNEQGLARCVCEVRRLAGGRRVHLLFAVMRDKNWRAMVRRVAPLCATATVTQVQPPRGLPPEEAAPAFAAQNVPVRCDPDPVRAFRGVRERCGADEVILVAGSLFLVGAVYPECGAGRSRAPASGAARLVHP